MMSAAPKLELETGIQRIAIIDDDRDFADSIAEYLSLHEYTVETANDAAKAHTLIESFIPNVALLDLQFGTENRLDLLASLKAAQPELVCILTTAFADTDVAIDALHLGASDILQKPFRFEELLSTLNRSFENIELRRQKQEAEHALWESENRFRAVIDSLPIALTVKNPAGEFLISNNTYASWFDRNSDEIVGRTVHDIHPRDLAESIERQDKLVLETGQIIELERTISGRHGKERVVISLKFPVRDTNGEIASVCTIDTDMTERKQTDAMIIHADKLATLGRMASGMSHELSQPLNILRLITNSVQLDIEDDILDPSELKKTLAGIDAQIVRMADIINRMGIFAQDDAGSQTTFLPHECVESVLKLLDPHLQANGVRLSSDLSQAGRPVSGSPTQLEQVILHIINNATDALTSRMETETPDDFIGAIDVGVRDDFATGEVSIRVLDNGGGMDDEALKRLFDPFFTTKDVGNGMGLGLWVSHSVVESMGGTLNAENREGGALFEIRLPLAAEA